MEQLWYMLQVALGIGLVIFVHEAGHFLAARWCKVRVETFSLGFGPRLFGWTRGDTLYQIAAVPLGGYVKMAGEDVYDPDAPRNPGDLGSKSIPQRFLIYSGGVIMNMIFALIVFPIVFSAGVPFNEPMIGPPVPGGAAWKAGLEEGTRIRSVNGEPTYAYMHIPNGVALGPEGRAELEIQSPGSDEIRTVTVVPEFSEAAGLQEIGVGRARDPEFKIVVGKGTRAEELGLEEGDRLVEWKDGLEGLTFEEHMVQLFSAHRPFAGIFAKPSGERLEVTLPYEPPPKGSRAIMGVAPLVNRVVATRGRAAELRLEEGDLLLSVGEVPLWKSGDLLRALSLAEGPIVLTVRRGDDVFPVEVGELSREAAQDLARDIALTLNTESQAVSVNADSIAERTGLRSGDRVIDLDGSPIKTFADITKASKKASKEDRAVSLTVLRSLEGGGEEELHFTIKGEPYSQSHGFDLMPARYVYEAETPTEAIAVGVASAWKFLEDTWLTLKSIALGRVASDQVGGIITIGVVAKSFANESLTKLFFFLCILSVNLAFLNVLPIPVLDGGHLFFLLIEAIKGSPVSERVMSYSQLVGLVLIVSLMVYVIHNDLMRWVFQGS